MVSPFIPANTLQPYGLTLGSDGWLYVADNHNYIDTVDLLTGTTRLLVPYQYGLDSPGFIVEVPEPAVAQLGLGFALAALLFRRRPLKALEIPADKDLTIR